MQCREGEGSGIEELFFEEGMSRFELIGITDRETL